ncbi:hypothetical protein JSY14_11325 [Brachybacterium sp. EF45031]|uniref:hypothetical protein n=1 Tax=Brachybacterium sillae TaxID=2810536 RepID=UPI00217D4021|nr:hypothetical protein [Brachybacterium sillae]MCS6712580.1 hypothetical protein [Brachybacterium sillae]
MTRPAPDSFAVVLRRALQERGLGVAEAATSAMRRGVALTPATITHWCEGDIVPDPREDRELLDALEEVLRLDRGRLSAAARADTGVAPRRWTRPGEYGPELRDVLRQWAFPVDDGLERRVVVVTRFAEEIGPVRTRFEVVVEATRSGADRFVTVFDTSDETDSEPARVQAIRNCRRGRSVTTSQSQTLVEVILPRPLTEGETATVTYDWLFDTARVPPSALAIWSLQRLSALAVVVRFPDPDRSVWMRTALTSLGRDGSETRTGQPYARTRAGGVGAVLVDAEAGSVEVVWEAEPGDRA